MRPAASPRPPGAWTLLLPSLPLLLLLLGGTAGLRRASAGETDAPLDARAFPDAAAPLLTHFAHESVRAYAEGRAPVERFPEPFATAANGVHVVLFREGRLLGEAHARQSRLAGNIRVAAARAAAGVPEDDLAAADLVMTVLLPERPVPGRKPLPIRLEASLRPGLEGLRLAHDGREALAPPLAPLLSEQDTAALLLDLAREVAPASTDPDSPAETTRLLRLLAGLEGPVEARLVPGVTYARTRGGEAARLRRLSRAVGSREVTAAALTEAAARARRWLAAETGAPASGEASADAADSAPAAMDEAETRRLFERADRLLLAQIGETTAPAPDLAGAFRGADGGVGSSSASAEATRLLARAARRARFLAHPRAERYARGLRDGARFLLELQVRGRIDALDLPRPEAAVGALRASPAARATDTVLTALAAEAFREGAAALAGE